MSRLNGASAGERPTSLLIGLGAGDTSAREELLSLVYDELRRIAALYLSRERPGHTLQPTALVHEAYLRLIDQRRVDWRNRAQFVGVAAMMMRRVLVNHARDRVAAKRGSGAEHIPLTMAIDALEQPVVDVLAIHNALDRLHGLDARKRRSTWCRSSSLPAHASARKARRASPLSGRAA